METEPVSSVRPVALNVFLMEDAQLVWILPNILPQPTDVSPAERDARLAAMIWNAPLARISTISFILPTRNATSVEKAAVSATSQAAVPSVRMLWTTSTRLRTSASDADHHVLPVLRATLA